MIKDGWSPPPGIVTGLTLLLAKLLFMGIFMADRGIATFKGNSCQF